MRLRARFRHLLVRARRTSRHGAGPAGRCAIVFWYLALPLKRRIGWLDRRVVVLRLSILGTERRLAFSERSELVALEEILCDREYDLPLGYSPLTIIDAGANVGASVLWFAARFPSARIIALEPDPRTFRKLVVTVSGVGGVDVVAAALAGSSGSASLFQAEQTWASRIVGAETTGTVTVETLSIRAVMDRFGLERVDLVKLDIEGMEWEVLPDAVLVARDVLVEVHGDQRVRQLETLNGETLGAKLTWSGDRVAHLRP